MPKQARKKVETWPDKLRAAVEASELTGYRIAQLAGIQQSQLARIMAGQGCGLETAERIGRVVGLDLLPVEEPSSAELD
jgi:hypothetical protein